MSTLHGSIAVTGMGVITPAGPGVGQFRAALRGGHTHFSVRTFEHHDALFRFPAALAAPPDLRELAGGAGLPAEIIEKAKRLRNISTSTAYAVYCALEAWANAGLPGTDTDPARLAIVVAGSNTQQASLQAVYDKYHATLRFINPNHALNFFDTDVAGVLSALLGIRGEGCSIGAASASGNMGLIQGYRLMDTGLYDAVLVVAPLMDISVYEYQAFTAMGAMAGLRDDLPPEALCRPFDADHCGFVYGQSAGCVVLEAPARAAKRGKQPHGYLAGYGACMHATRSSSPLAEGEKTAMALALRHAALTRDQIGYVNTHGTASVVGDQAEVEALLSVGLEGVKANSTKSLIGHGLSAAGLVEAIAALIQIEEGFVHPTRNLTNPITARIDWITGEARAARIDYAMTNSFGFGGINTSVIIGRNEGAAR